MIRTIAVYFRRSFGNLRLQKKILLNSNRTIRYYYHVGFAVYLKHNAHKLLSQCNRESANAVRTNTNLQKFKANCTFSLSLEPIWPFEDNWHSQSLSKRLNFRLGPKTRGEREASGTPGSGSLICPALLTEPNKEGRPSSARPSSAISPTTDDERIPTVFFFSRVCTLFGVKWL